jgi:hypothetical protein
MDQEEEEFRYRFEDAYELDGQPFLCKFRVTRRTPRGVMINCWGTEKFILAGTDGKRYAYPTEEQALYSYKRRKQRAISILTNQLDKQMQMLHRANGGKLEKDEFLQFTG